MKNVLIIEIVYFTGESFYIGHGEKKRNLLFFTLGRFNGFGRCDNGLKNVKKKRVEW